MVVKPARVTDPGMATLFDGPSLTPADGERLGRCLQAVRDIMADGRWRTFEQIMAALSVQGISASEAGVSARLRDLRKDRFGGYVVERRRRTAGVWEYRVVGRR